MSVSSLSLRARLLDSMLVVAASHGWNAGAVRRAAEETGFCEDDLALAAPPGVSNPAFALLTPLLQDWADQANAHTCRSLQAQDLSSMRVRDRIVVGVKIHIAFFAPYRESMRAGCLASVAPWRALLAPRLLFNAAHTIWQQAGDVSTDWNWYSKRLILSAVMATTLSVWLENEEEALAWRQLDQAVEGVMRFESFKRKARHRSAKWPNPMNILGGRRPAP